MKEKTFTDSSSVRHIKYDEEKKIMTITFTTNAKYEYLDVPKHTWEDALAAPSIGRFVSQNIKNTYTCNRL